jgi:hypothetical protein
VRKIFFGRSFGKHKSILASQGRVLVALLSTLKSIQNGIPEEFVEIARRCMPVALTPPERRENPSFPVATAKTFQFPNKTALFTSKTSFVSRFHAYTQ